MKVTILGSGGSGGVPLINGNWGKCNPNNPKNRRRRVSLLVEIKNKVILIDASPDLRSQLLDANVKKLDAILFTHAHADHCHGIDDIRFMPRPLKDQPFNCYGDQETIEELKIKFNYIFNQTHKGSWNLYKPFLNPHIVTESFYIDDIEVIPFEQNHGPNTKTLGYRIGNMAYSTDVVKIPEQSFQYLHNLDLWIVDCLLWEAHQTHAHVDLALEWIKRVKPKHAVLTHLGTLMDYDELKSYCPPNVEPAYDGLNFTLVS
ncbi:MAG: MBL fold metallo-hydrolase [Alphaproteobacteria bacterium]|nr:MBL fold metallo-hydrolase [Alphaproteobacteria bacterium]